MESLKFIKKEKEDFTICTYYSKLNPINSPTAIINRKDYIWIPNITDSKIKVFWEMWSRIYCSRKNAI
jgi:hypothetical protein